MYEENTPLILFMGPDLNYARKRGNEVGKELLNHLLAAHNLWDITDPKYDCMSTWPDARIRWEKAKTDFIKSVEELFVEDETNGF